MDLKKIKEVTCEMLGNVLGQSVNIVICPYCEDDDCYVHSKKFDDANNHNCCVICDKCEFDGPEAETAEQAILLWNRYCFEYHHGQRM